MYKIFSGIINDRLYAWAADHDIIEESQAGFRPGYSVADNLFCLQSMVQKYITKPGGRFYVLYVDFKKAFDSLLHFKLFSNLADKGMNGKVLTVLISMYSKLRAHVKVEGNTITQQFNCNVGTRQGDLSSPIIFSLYINDLVQYIRDTCRNGIFITNNIPDIFCLMYADDVANCADTANNLQLQLNAVSKFCQDTGMQVNLKKTEIIVFRNGGPLRNYEKWILNGQQVNTVSVYKYMGLLFTPKLVWTAAKTKLAAQARKAAFSIKQYQKPFGYFSHSDTFKLFDSMVTPILTFGSELWGFAHSEIIERSHVEFCKYFLGVNSTVNNSMVLGECGRLPLCITYYSKCIKYWCTLLQMPNHRYPVNCYKMLKSLDDVGRRTWATSVKDLLFRFGFGYVWVSQDVGDINMFIYTFKQRVTDCMTQNWHSDIDTSSRCDTYKHFKSLLTPEKYLSIDLPFKIRRALARFRCSNHKLNIELGRHYNVQRDDRICLHCFTHLNVQVIENECHAFFECPQYEGIRTNYLLNWYSGQICQISFNHLMNHDDTFTVKQVAYFISQIMTAIENR